MSNNEQSNQVISFVIAAFHFTLSTVAPHPLRGRISERRNGITDSAFRGSYWNGYVVAYFNDFKYVSRWPYVEKPPSRSRHLYHVIFSVSSVSYTQVCRLVMQCSYDDKHLNRQLGEIVSLSKKRN